MRPYTQIVDGNQIIRRFYSESDSDEFVWHRDERDRTVTVLSGKGWLFQPDNSLPVSLDAGVIIHIPRDSWHRIIRGPGDLEVMISES